MGRKKKEEDQFEDVVTEDKEEPETQEKEDFDRDELEYLKRQISDHLHGFCGFTTNDVDRVHKFLQTL